MTATTICITAARMQRLNAKRADRTRRPASVHFAGTAQADGFLSARFAPVAGTDRARQLISRLGRTAPATALHPALSAAGTEGIERVVAALLDDRIAYELRDLLRARHGDALYAILYHEAVIAHLADAPTSRRIAWRVLVAALSIRCGKDQFGKHDLSTPAPFAIAA